MLPRSRFPWCLLFCPGFSLLCKTVFFVLPRSQSMLCSFPVRLPPCLLPNVPLLFGCIRSCLSSVWISRDCICLWFLSPRVFFLFFGGLSGSRSPNTFHISIGRWFSKKVPLPVPVHTLSVPATMSLSVSRLCIESSLRSNTFPDGSMNDATYISFGLYADSNSVHHSCMCNSFEVPVTPYSHFAPSFLRFLCNYIPFCNIPVDMSALLW